MAAGAPVPYTGATMRSALSCALLVALLPVASEAAAPRVLLFTEADGFVHPSIADGIAALSAMAGKEGFALDVVDTSDGFTPANLALYDTVVWLSTTGDVLTAAEQAAFEGFVQAGGGWVGIHAAADCEYAWPWYGGLLGNGAWFDSHPAIQEAQVDLEGFGEPGAGAFPASGPFTDEWYNFQANPRPAVTVVLTVDEESYEPGPGAMGPDHPIAWHHVWDGGRAFYTVLGHRSETWQDSRFLSQIRAAILWTAGAFLFEDGFESGSTGAWDAAVP